MTPDAATVRDLLILVGALSAVVLLQIGVIWWFDSLISKGCSSCAHCIDREKRRQQAAEAAAAETRERLFGRQIEDGPSEEVEPQPSGAQGRPLDDEGRGDPEG